MFTSNSISLPSHTLQIMFFVLFSVRLFSEVKKAGISEDVILGQVNCLVPVTLPSLRTTPVIVCFITVLFFFTFV